MKRFQVVALLVLALVAVAGGLPSLACDESMVVSDESFEPGAIPAAEQSEVVVLEPVTATVDQRNKKRSGKPSSYIKPQQVSSPPLLAKPGFDVIPAMVISAIGFGGIAIMAVLRRRRSAMWILGASLMGVCVAIGYFWPNL